MILVCSLMPMMDLEHIVVHARIIILLPSAPAILEDSLVEELGLSAITIVLSMNLCIKIIGVGVVRTVCERGLISE
jgi:hypothetical protein